MGDALFCSPWRFDQYTASQWLYFSSTAIEDLCISMLISSIMKIRTIDQKRHIWYSNAAIETHWYVSTSTNDLLLNGRFVSLWFLHSTNNALQIPSKDSFPKNILCTCARDVLHAKHQPYTTHSSAILGGIYTLFWKPCDSMNRDHVWSLACPWCFRHHDKEHSYLIFFTTCNW